MSSLSSHAKCVAACLSGVHVGPHALSYCKARKQTLHKRCKHISNRYRWNHKCNSCTVSKSWCQAIGNLNIWATGQRVPKAVISNRCRANHRGEYCTIHKQIECRHWSSCVWARRPCFWDGAWTFYIFVWESSSLAKKNTNQKPGTPSQKKTKGQR